MINIFPGIIASFLGLILFMFSVATGNPSSDEDEDYYRIGLRGVERYTEGDYVAAAPDLLYAINHGQDSFILTYADICKRNLDQAGHTLAEAAGLYIKAADSGDGDALSYVSSVSDTLMALPSTEKKVEALVALWQEDQASMEDVPSVDARNGFTLYREGKYAEAAPLLLKESERNHPHAQELYADICYRQLDKAPHSLLEAAMWYLLAAKNGSTQSDSYVRSLVPRIWDIQEGKDQMRAIVLSWVLNLAQEDFEAVSPENINGYITFKHGHEIDKTTSQKIPYFFNKVIIGILCNLTSQVASPTQQDLTAGGRGNPSNTVLTDRCSLEHLGARPVIGQQSSPWVFGPVFPKYFRTLDYLIVNNVLSRPRKEPKLPVLYRMVLDALFEVFLKSNGATKLTDISHEEYPWLLAGVRLWEAKHSKLFKIRRMERDSLIAVLEKMEESLSQGVIKEVRKFIDPKDLNEIWPNKVEDEEDPISNEFRRNTEKFFTSIVSRCNPIVTEVQGKLLNSLRVLSIQDCHDEANRELLENPIIMYFCQDLILENVPSSIKFLNTFRTAHRYLASLRSLSVTYAADFKATPTGKKIKDLIEKTKSELEID